MLNRGELLKCDACWRFGAMRVMEVRTLADAVVVALECRYCGPETFRVVGARGRQAAAFSAAAKKEQEVTTP